MFFVTLTIVGFLNVALKKSVLFNKLLIISGPTATGKTDLAIKLSKKFNGELISADSRQIYRSMDIGTGKDHPKDIKIHLIDIINPDQSFSVAQYRQLALEKIVEIHNKNKLPVIVGGTGQYIDSLINPQETFNIPPNNLLRFFLNKFSVKYLQIIYKLLDKNNYLKLNNSDINNPHRLIRKIEIKLSNKKNNNLLKNNFNILHISLTAPNDFLYQRIDVRVQKRLELGLFNEIKNLLKKYKWENLDCLAYKEFKTGFNQQNINKWRFDEHGYCRRQKTFFNKLTPINFIDITAPNFSQKTVDIVKKWYNMP